MNDPKLFDERNGSFLNDMKMYYEKGCRFSQKKNLMDNLKWIHQYIWWKKTRWNLSNWSLKKSLNKIFEKKN